jgi:hypothetical protein
VDARRIGPRWPRNGRSIFGERRIADFRPTFPKPSVAIAALYGVTKVARRSCNNLSATIHQDTGTAARAGSRLGTPPANSSPHPFLGWMKRARIARSLQGSRWPQVARAYVRERLRQTDVSRRSHFRRNCDALHVTSGEANKTGWGVGGSDRHSSAVRAACHTLLHTGHNAAHTLPLTRKPKPRDMVQSVSVLPRDNERTPHTENL